MYESEDVSEPETRKVEKKIKHAPRSAADLLKNIDGKMGASLRSIQELLARKVLPLVKKDQRPNVLDTIECIRTTFGSPEDAFRYFSLDVKSWDRETVQYFFDDVCFLHDIAKQLLIGTDSNPGPVKSDEKFTILFSRQRLVLTMRGAYSRRGYFEIAEDTLKCRCSFPLEELRTAYFMTEILGSPIASHNSSN